MKNKKDFFLNILGHKYKVRHVDAEVLSDDEIGRADFENKEILILNGLDSNTYWSTLIHEVSHVVFLRSSLCYAVDDELEEIIVEQISTVIIENFSLKVLK